MPRAWRWSGSRGSTPATSTSSAEAALPLVVPPLVALEIAMRARYSLIRLGEADGVPGLRLPLMRTGLSVLALVVVAPLEEPAP